MLVIVSLSVARGPPRERGNGASGLVSPAFLPVGRTDRTYSYNPAPDKESQKLPLQVMSRVTQRPHVSRSGSSTGLSSQVAGWLRASLGSVNECLVFMTL